MHKGNIQKFTEGAFRNWGYQLAEREFAAQTYTWEQWERTKAAKGEKDGQRRRWTRPRKAGRVIIKDAIADITLQQVLTRPDEFDVIATLNLNGDYLSDALAAQVGGIGIAPGGNINYLTGHAVFEATHGTAPKYANLDKVNPGSVILSGEMMFRYMGWLEAADAIITRDGPHHRPEDRDLRLRPPDGGRAGGGDERLRRRADPQPVSAGGGGMPSLRRPAAPRAAIRARPPELGFGTGCRMYLRGAAADTPRSWRRSRRRACRAHASARHRPHAPLPAPCRARAQLALPRAGRHQGVRGRCTWSGLKLVIRKSERAAFESARGR